MVPFFIGGRAGESGKPVINWTFVQRKIKHHPQPNTETRLVGMGLPLWPYLWIPLLVSNSIKQAYYLLTTSWQGLAIGSHTRHWLWVLCFAHKKFTIFTMPMSSKSSQRNRICTGHHGISFLNIIFQLLCKNFWIFFCLVNLKIDNWQWSRIFSSTVTKTCSGLLYLSSVIVIELLCVWNNSWMIVIELLHS